MIQSSITAWLKKPASDMTANVSSTEEAEISPSLVSPRPCFPVAIEAGTSEFPDQAVVAEETNLRDAFALQPLPPNVELVPLTEDLLPAFKRLNAVLLPIPYPSAFYAETMTEPHHGLTLMALWHPEPSSGQPVSKKEKPRLIGAIRCRILPSATLYISTLGLLSPYRSYGIATHMLQKISVKASKEHGMRYVAAHVWEANQLGLDWYTRRGFGVIGKEDGYYGKLKPTGAVLVRKRIDVSDLLRSSDASDEKTT